MRAPLAGERAVRTRGQIQRDVSNERWCSDVLAIACWNGEVEQCGVALDCHDREALGQVAVPHDGRATEFSS